LVVVIPQHHPEPLLSQEKSVLAIPLTGWSPSRCATCCIRFRKRRVSGELQQKAIVDWASVRDDDDEESFIVLSEDGRGSDDPVERRGSRSRQ
jgi:KaiC/GvpD/RAD55 family RecA-like ATPase